MRNWLPTLVVVIPSRSSIEPTSQTLSISSSEQSPIKQVLRKTRNARGNTHVRSNDLGKPVSRRRLVAIRSLDEIRADANFKESQLRGLRIGQQVDLYLDR